MPAEEAQEKIKSEQDVNQTEVDESQAPIMDHLYELRNRMVKSLIALIVFACLCGFFVTDIFNILLVPFVDATDPSETAKIILTGLPELFFVYLKLALFGGIILGFPYISFQIYAFVAPGLYQNERGAFIPYLVATPVLFAIGASLVYFLVMPLAMTFFLGLEQVGGIGEASIQLEPRASEYLGLVMTLILGFGLIFQLPVVLTLLARIGVVSSGWLKSKRKFAIVIIFAVSAILTPPDPASQLGMAIPTLLLYEFSILAVMWIERSRKKARKKAEEADDETNDDDNENT
ncbi:MAG: twin-arginine translocase subunit TatC [Rhizobiales bacterium]|nr:twin-arginine translocase subunit TatC [Hyphomicrobiales bacterium]